MQVRIKSIGQCLEQGLLKTYRVSHSPEVLYVSQDGTWIVEKMGINGSYQKTALSLQLGRWVMLVRLKTVGRLMEEGLILPRHPNDPQHWAYRTNTRIVITVSMIQDLGKTVTSLYRRDDRILCVLDGRFRYLPANFINESSWEIRYTPGR